MKNKNVSLKEKKKKLKLIEPIMSFNIGLLGFEIDIKKTKKSLKLKNKKKK